MCKSKDHRMTRNLIRSLLKGIIWELTAPIVLYMFVQEWRILLGYFGVRTVMFFLYVRLWKKISWGK